MVDYKNQLTYLFNDILVIVKLIFNSTNIFNTLKTTSYLR